MNAHYMLRRSLHLWQAEQNIAEGVDYCVRHDIDEVMWKIDVEQFNHGLTTLERIRQYVPWLNQARQALAEKNILSSINPWVTLNHGDRWRDMREVYPEMTWMVDASGVCSKACACPLSQGWQAWLTEAYRLYATTKPEILWLEDDYRNFNHHPVGWGCYCPAHMQSLGAAIGQPITREQLVDRLLKPGEPDPIRATWFDLLGRPLVEAAAKVEKAVHQESPQTRLALMCSDSLDGRWWPQAMEAMAGPHEPVARPSFSPYVEERATTLMSDQRDLEKEICCLPEGTRICPELENYPYSLYSKSARFTRLELGLSQLFGHAAITMNLFDHVGEPMSEDRRYGQMLQQTKPLLNALAARCGPGGRRRGVQVLFHMRQADHKRLKNTDGMGDLLFHRDAEGWAKPLQGSGIPVIWGESSVRCTTGQVLRAFEPDVVRQMLSGGMLVDSSGLKVLHDMGLGDLTGVEAEQGQAPAGTSLVAEAVLDKEHSGANQRYMAITTVTPADVWVFAPRSGAKVISQIVDADREPVIPGMTLYENELGGRVAVYPFDLSGGIDSFFMNKPRKAQLSQVVRWLGRGKVDLCVEGDCSWMVPFRRDYDGYTLVGLANMETDDWPQISMTFDGGSEREPSSVLMPDKSGNWLRVRPAELTVKDQHIHVVLDTELRALDFTAVVFEWR